MPSTTEEAALIRSVVAHPDDDTPRLVYADWLDEHGQTDRARLIRVQCQIENLRTEETSLLARHHSEWGSELYDNGADHWVFHRGFPEEISISLRNFLDTHMALNAVTPLRQLHLAGNSDDGLAQLAVQPVLGQVRMLELGRPSPNADLAGSDYGLDGIRALSTSPHLADLRHLSLNSHRIGIEGARLIASAPTFSNLTHLTLSDPHLLGCEPDVLSQLIASPTLRNLVELHWGEDVPSYALGVFRQSSRSPIPPAPR